jgi:hypothetical protein
VFTPYRDGLDPAEDSHEAVVNEEAVPAAEEGQAFLLNANAGFLLIADDKVMDLQAGLVNQPHSLLDRLFVDFDDQAAQELVEVILQKVFFGVSDLNSELHRFIAFHRALHAIGAWIVPERGGQKIFGV